MGLFGEEVRSWAGKETLSLGERLGQEMKGWDFTQEGSREMPNGFP